jgi:NADPH-ferrihemoprotein reductase
MVSIYIMATYGEGEPTDSARSFYEWLGATSHHKDLFEGSKFTVFGLGNKTYQNYNAAARYLDSRLEALGATRIFRRGEGDDNENLEDDFIRWKDDMWLTLYPIFGIKKEAMVQEVL